MYIYIYTLYICIYYIILIVSLYMYLNIYLSIYIYHNKSIYIYIILLSIYIYLHGAYGKVSLNFPLLKPVTSASQKHCSAAPNVSPRMCFLKRSSCTVAFLRETQWTHMEKHRKNTKGIDT